LDKLFSMTQRFCFDSDLVALGSDVEHDTIIDINGKSIVDDDPFADWADDDTSGAKGVASGSQSEALPTTSRTATVVDPLTTTLLAEVSRHSQTQEIPASVLAAAVEETKRR
jgi:hypothetical protein